MSSRYKDWLDQGECDVRHARDAARSDSHEWSCFAAQQGAEKAIKALYFRRGGDPWGHSLTKLLEELVSTKTAHVPSSVAAAARRLDRFYIPTRYPNGFDAGKPADYYTAEDSTSAIADAELVLSWVKDEIL